MKTASSSRTTSIIVIVIVIIAVIVYFYYQGQTAPAGSALEVQPGGEDVGLSTVRLLEQIQTVRIDSSFFGESAYRSLQDYSVAIPPQNVGRPNPFAPI